MAVTIDTVAAERERREGGRAARDRLEARLHGGLYLVLQLLRGRPVGPFIKRLQEWERLDRAELERLGRARLRRALRYARARVPLYRSGVWESALARSDPEEVRNWPLLERAVLREEGQRLLARPRPPAICWRYTSASAGEPLKFAFNPRAAAWSWAAEYQPMLRYGVRPGAKTLMLWAGSGAILDWVRGLETFPAADLTPALLDQAAEYLLRERPALLVGPPSAVARLARHVGAAHPGARRPVVPLAKVGGEQVYPFERDEIARYLGARVVEFYGCTEVGVIAAECPEGSRHVLTPLVHLEILRDGRPAEPGELGDVVVTSLVNRAMPLVRYRPGDRARLSPEPCRCGRPQPVVAEVLGRAEDLLVTADGGLAHGSVLGRGLGPLLAGLPPGAIGQVLFQQVDRTSWRVLVESPNGVEERVAAGLAEVVRAGFGRQCRVAVEPVARIPREPSGKYRYYRVPAGG